MKASHARAFVLTTNRAITYRCKGRLKAPFAAIAEAICFSSKRTYERPDDTDRVNFGISWWNAKQAGQSWLEARTLGDRAAASPPASKPAPQAAPVQQSTQAPSQQAMQQATQQEMAAQARGGRAKVTTNTYGNVVASFYPGKSPLVAIDDALVSIHSELTVIDIAPSGYPEYQVECESNGKCVGGTGTPMGAAVEIAKEMLPVNPADVDHDGIACSQYVCNDGKGNVIGRAPAIAE